VDPKGGISRVTTVAALLAIVIMAGASLYLGESSARTSIQSQAVPGSGNASTSAPTTSSSLTSGPDHQLIGEFDPDVPIITQSMPLNCTLYFSTVGTVPDHLNISLSSPNGISLSVYPNQIVEPGIAFYVDTTVVMQAPPGLPPGTYPVTITASGSGVTYTETLPVKVVG
jgi:hypothetical protein